MSTSPKDQDALRHDAPRRPPRQPQPGEFMWAVRKRNGTVIHCELRHHGAIGVEVQLFREGAWFYGRRWPRRADALVEVDELKAESLERGGVLLPDRTPSR